MSVNDPRSIEALPDSKELLSNRFGDQITSDKSTLTVFNREKTNKGSPITKSFDLNYENITQAVLKVNLIADQSTILGFIDNSFKITEINVNGKRFTPSDPRSSVNIIERVNDASLNKVLNKNGENSISISFDAPFGAGVVSPDAEITAILIIHGEKAPFSLTQDIPNLTQAGIDVQEFIKDNTGLTIGLGILLVIALVAVAFIVTKFGTGASAVGGITSDVKSIIKEVKN